MILPGKHLRLEESVLGLGSIVLTELKTSMSFDDLWREYSLRLEQRGLGAAVDVGLFVLAVDWLFMIGAIELTPDMQLRQCV